MQIPKHLPYNKIMLGVWDREQNGTANPENAPSPFVGGNGVRIFGSRQT